MPLRLERGLQPREQVVERLAELGELVVAAGDAEAAAQVAGRDVPRGRGDRAQRPQEPAGDQPAERDRDEHRGQEDERGADVEVAAAERSSARCCCRRHALTDALRTSRPETASRAAPSATKAPP